MACCNIFVVIFQMQIVASVGVDTEREREIEDICALNVQKFISHISSNRNQSSLTDLLVSFFDKVLIV
jgi:hypothetical protein